MDSATIQATQVNIQNTDRLSLSLRVPYAGILEPRESIKGHRGTPAESQILGSTVDPEETIIENAQALQSVPTLLSTDAATIKTFSTMIELNNQDLNSIIVATSSRLSKLITFSKKSSDPALRSRLEPLLEHSTACVTAATDARNAIDAASSAVLALYSNVCLLTNELNIVLNATEAASKPLNVVPDVVPNIAPIAFPNVALNKDKALPRIPRKPIANPTGSPMPIDNDRLRRSARYSCGPRLRKASDATQVLFGPSESKIPAPGGQRLRVSESMSNIGKAGRRVRKKISGLFTREN